MRRYYYVTAGFAAVAIIVPILLQPLQIPDPGELEIQIQLSNVKLKDDSSGALSVTFDVRNDMAISAAINRIEYELYADGKSLGSDIMSFEDIPSGGRPTAFPSHVTSVSDTFEPTLTQDKIIQNDIISEIRWAVNGTAHIETGRAVMVHQFSDIL